VTDEMLLRLPTSLRSLKVSFCRALTERASLVHLTGLTMLDCSWTGVVDDGVAGLPPSLQELEICGAYLPDGTSLAHLMHLRVLRVGICLDAATLASLPPSLLELDATLCQVLGSGASFDHLLALRTLTVSNTDINDASLASLPPSLVSLNARLCPNLTPAAALPPLPSLRQLDVSGTRVGDALVASLPAGLAELRMSLCAHITSCTTLDHVPGLQVLHSYGTDLAPGVLAGCRARGCVVPVAGVLRGHRHLVRSLALLADGRLASGDLRGEVRVWNVVAGGGEAGVVRLNTYGGGVVAMATLCGNFLGRHRLAASGAERVEVWVVDAVPPFCIETVDHCNGTVHALAVLRDGRLAAGRADGVVLIVDASNCHPVAMLEGHTGIVTAVAALPNGTLASGSDDKTVRVWDVDTRECVARLEGHADWVNALAVLPDGRLASGSIDGTVGLWDVGTRTCVGVLTGHTDCVTALAALPDGRLATGSSDGSIRVWDTRPAAAVAASHAAGSAPMVALAQGLGTLCALLLLPDGRLACAVEDAVHLLHVPPPVPYEVPEYR